MSHKPNTNHTPKQGFTLLELSIVLVIIGLIIGGITVGADLIESAEINSDISQFQKYDTAIATFKLKYNAFPGDMDNAESYWPASVAVNGNGNGKLENASGTTVGHFGDYGAEFAQFWAHLGLANLTKQYDASTTVEAGFPLLKSNDIPILVSECFYQIPKKCYQLRHGNVAAMPDMNAMDTDSFIPELAFQFDSKIDDGNASSGRFQAAREAGASCHSAGEYALATTTATCRPEYEMGVQ